MCDCRPGVRERGAPGKHSDTLEHVDDALAAEELSLSDEHIARLEEPYGPHDVSGIEL